MSVTNERSPVLPFQSRRTLLAALPAAWLAPAAFGQQSAAIALRKIHCFEIKVADVARSVAFYQRLFGMPAQSREGGRVCLRVGNGPAFMAVRPLLPGESPAITQLGYSVDGFDPAEQQAALNALGYATIQAPELSVPGIDNAMRTWLRVRGGTPELYFADAHGLIVQLSDSDYCGGTSGGGCESIEAAPAGLFSLDAINHFTVFVDDPASVNGYYQKTFGLRVQAYQGPAAPVFGIGDGRQFVMYARRIGADAGAASRIHHGCFSVAQFDVATILAKLTSAGLRARANGEEVGPMMHYVTQRQPDRGGAPGGTPELYFSDPDGVLMQLQDARYCGGGGYLGDECPVV